MEIRKMQADAWENSEKHGFHKSIHIPTALLLLIQEATEAFDEIRDGNDLTVNRYELNGKPSGFPSEIADIVIRAGDIAGTVGFDLEAAIAEKMAYNLKRPFMHGLTCKGKDQMQIELSPEMRASVDSIKAELRSGESLVTRGRQTGKTLALLEYIHETVGGDVNLIVCNGIQADLIARKYREMFPEDKQPRVRSISNADGTDLIGSDRGWATDEVWPSDVVRKAWIYETQTFVGGVGTPMCVDMHSTKNEDSNR